MARRQSDFATSITPASEAEVIRGTGTKAD